MVAIAPFKLPQNLVRDFRPREGNSRKRWGPFFDAGMYLVRTAQQWFKRGPQECPRLRLRGRGHRLFRDYQ